MWPELQQAFACQIYFALYFFVNVIDLSSQIKENEVGGMCSIEEKRNIYRILVNKTLKGNAA
jgi:hypothetical protein